MHSPLFFFLLPCTKPAWSRPVMNWESEAVDPRLSSCLATLRGSYRERTNRTVVTHCRTDGGRPPLPLGLLFHPSSLSIPSVSVSKGTAESVAIEEFTRTKAPATFLNNGVCVLGEAPDYGAATNNGGFPFSVFMQRLRSRIKL